MKYREITIAQATKLKETIDVQLNFYSRLCDRLDRRGIPADDFTQDVWAARDTVQRLSSFLHERTLPNGYGGYRKKD
jgi:hypothetical protein